MAASLPVLNAAIPKKWRSPSNSLHVIGNFGVSANRGSQRLESNEKIQNDNQKNGPGASNAPQDEKRADFKLPEIQPAQGLQDPVPTHREHLCNGVHKGEDMA